MKHTLLSVWPYFPMFLIFGFCGWVLLYDRHYSQQGRRAAKEYKAKPGVTKSDLLDACVYSWKHSPYSNKTDWRKHTEWCEGFEYELNGL